MKKIILILLITQFIFSISYGQNTLSEIEKKINKADKQGNYIPAKCLTCEKNNLVFTDTIGRTVNFDGISEEANKKEILKLIKATSNSDKLLEIWWEIIKDKKEKTTQRLILKINEVKDLNIFRKFSYSKNLISGKWKAQKITYVPRAIKTVKDSANQKFEMLMADDLIANQSKWELTFGKDYTYSQLYNSDINTGFWSVSPDGNFVLISSGKNNENMTLSIKSLTSTELHLQTTDGLIMQDFFMIKKE